jgi:acetoin utilization protein AcuC
MNRTAYLFHGDILNYRFHDAHPFNQQRIVITHDLLTKLGALQPSQFIPFHPAEEYQLSWIHTPSYLESVKALSTAKPSIKALKKAKSFGLHHGDTPHFFDMHAVTSRIVGGTIAAAEQVMSGAVDHALHLGGGLHHALSNKASGFCIYNDASVAIAYLRHHYNARVLYVDTDVHHGDGVQWSFYTDPNVCTVSIHETGKFLFPGTGFVGERGEELGFGTSINMPLEPFTEDESWLECFEEVLTKAIAFFKPDIIISQHGCDAHAFDPLSHAHCSMEIYKAMPQLIHRMAHQWCEGRWVALGGGGYDIWRVVPRAWSLLWLEMNDHPLCQELERDSLIPLPPAWIDKWQSFSEHPLPKTWLDDKQNDTWEMIPRRQAITDQNRLTKQTALLYLK